MTFRFFARGRKSQLCKPLLRKFLLCVTLSSALAISGGGAHALDIGPRDVPVKIFGLALRIPVTASLDMHTEADRIAVNLVANGDLATLQENALEIARHLPLPDDACRHKGANMVVNAIDDAHIRADGDTAVIDMAGRVTLWGCAKVLGAKVKTKLATDTVSIVLPVELYTPSPRRIGLRVKGSAEIHTRDPQLEQAATALLGDLNARFTQAVSKALESDRAQPGIPDIPGLDVRIDRTAFAEDQGRLLVRTHVEGRATSEAVNTLLDLMKK